MVASQPGFIQPSGLLSEPARTIPPESGALPDPVQLTALELSLATASLEALEETGRRATGLDPTAVVGALAGISELAVLRTCQRVELYFWSAGTVDAEAVLSALRLPSEGWSRHRGDSGVEHLFRVAAGVESMALGEREVREQVRAAAGGVVSRAPRPVLRPLLLEAARTADEVAPVVPASRSLAGLAADRLQAEFPAAHPRVLIVGTGVVGRQLAELLAPVARLTLLYRTRPPGARFLRLTGARAEPWARLEPELLRAEAVVTAAKAGATLVDARLLARRRRPLFLIDLGLPRNVDPAVAENPAVRLVNLGGLRPSRPPPESLVVGRALRSRAQEAARRLEVRGFESWVDAVRRQAELTRRQLVGETRASLGELTVTQLAIIDRLTRQLVSRLLDEPTSALRAIPPGRAGRRFRRWAVELLRPVRTRP